jgi:regulator of PEP synthase PpsR (kinase-PPPase family)
MTKFHLHLVSDATGETINAVAKAALVQFENAEPVQHVWTMVRSRAQLARVMAGVMEEPGLVLFTIVDHVLREALQDECRRRQIPSVSVLDPVLAAFGALLGAQSREQPGRQHVMDAEYFHRIDAMHYCMAHDDGQNADHLVEAEVILVGVSRTSKTPTCIYLANRGVKAANIPIVPGLPLPNAIEEPRSGQFIVGLTASPERLVQIRRNRLLALSQTQDTDYVDMEAVKQEVAYARKLFTKRGWPVIDVTRRSIEETAAAIMGLRAGREATTDGAPPRRTG